jgi:polygalacturonase
MHIVTIFARWLGGFSLLLLVSVNGHAKVKGVPQDITPLNPPFKMQQLQRPSFPDRVFDIRDYGAKTLEQREGYKNTEEIAATIEAAAKAGGGSVLIPKGKWLTGPIHLKSNINLKLAKGAEVLFSEDKEDYLPVVLQRHEGVEAYNYSPMIYAFEVENVAITGEGTLNAQGEHWWKWYEKYGPPPRAIASKVPLSRRDFGKGSGMEGMRPSFVLFWDSRNILVEDITLIDTPMWNVHLAYCDQIIVRGITVDSVEAPNGDGIVLDSSKNALIEYNHLQTGDDAVVLKSGLNEEGLEINIPTENIVVRNFEAKNVKTGSGGVVFGSETSGGIRNVYVHNAYFESTDRGIRFKTERGRGNVVENIFIENVKMKNVTYEAINFNTFYTGPGKVGPSPAMRNVIIKDVQIDGVPNAIVLVGLPEKWLENIHLENIDVVNSDEGARIARVKNFTMKNVNIQSKKRAMEVDDVYEVFLDELSLSDEFDGKPMLIKGRYTGSIFTDDFNVGEIEFEDGLDASIISEQPAVQGW